MQLSRALLTQPCVLFKKAGSAQWKNLTEPIKDRLCIVNAHHRIKTKRYSEGKYDCDKL
jgi:hypothetical protein